MDEVRERWRNAARRLLRRARRPAALEREPTGTALREATAAASVRDALLACVERGLAHEDPRFATIIRRGDLEGTPLKAIGADLHVSPRQLARYRAAAIDAIGAEMLRVTEAAAGVPRDPRAAEARRALEAAEYLVSRKGLVSDTVCAIAAARRALRIDPRLVDAWLVVAAGYISLGATDGAATLAHARAALERAEALAPRSGAVRAMRAALTWWSTRDALRVRPLAEDALGSEDGATRGRYALGWIATLDDDFEAAQRHFGAGAAREPYIGFNRCSLVTVSFLRGEYAWCAQTCAELHDSEPECSFVTGTYAETLNALGRYAECAAMVANAPADPLAHGTQAAFARALALSGDRDGALAVARAFRGPLVEQAGIALSLGDEDAAWRALERAPAERSALLEYVPFDPVFSSIAAEPRFLKVLAESRRLN
ncbi:MAG TPA: hypothetical protein VGD01_17375 [Candidatus Elarobacter sp.]|jgi:hypothetical protein